MKYRIMKDISYVLSYEKFSLYDPQLKYPCPDISKFKDMIITSDVSWYFQKARKQQILM